MAREKVGTEMERRKELRAYKHNKEGLRQRALSRIMTAM